jgi:DNA repair protein RecO (recombination protein O)
MDWTDEGIVLGTRRHGEANAILEVMTRAHGRHLGLVLSQGSGDQPAAPPLLYFGRSAVGATVVGLEAG